MAVWPCGKGAADVGGDVHDVAVTLDGHHFADDDGADFGDPADVVAVQIDEHDVLGSFFWIGQ